MSLASLLRPTEVFMGRLFSFVTSRYIFACCLLVAWGGTVDRVVAQARDPIPAQTAAADPPAHVSLVDGTAVLERDGQRDSSPANMPLLAGDRLRTENGRVEILFADNSTLHLDANTTIDFQSDDLVRLLAGRIRLAIPGPARDVSYRVDAPFASALINQPGEYKISVLENAAERQVELAVLRGSAELVNDDGRTLLRAGERAYARADAAPSYGYAFNSASWDAFDRWSETLRDQRLGVSSQYLPSEVQPYASAFDQYGSWQYNTSYGYVWYPSVAVGWRPYYQGRWVAVRPYGWTWVGAGPWSWPTHHYGRWGFSAGAWFWIPGHTWGPAWVSWAYAPGYVSWCPLGWNNRAVLQFGFSFGYDPWHAWTVVPYAHFGHGYVHVNYVGGHGFDSHTQAAFVPRYTAPSWNGYAVPRAASPIHVAGTARPRTPASTIYTNLDASASRVGQQGRRVIVGPPRSRVADSSAQSGPDGSGTRAVARGVPNASASSLNVAPRSDGDRIATPSQPSYGARVDRPRAAGPQYAGPRSYGDPADTGGRAVPRSYPSYGGRVPESARPAAAPSPAYGPVPPMTPETSRPSMPDYRGSGDRRAPGVERPSAPPPEAARPPVRDYHVNPGAGPGPGAPAPDNHGGGGAPQGHSRGGQAVPRGRG
jgi:hypothetical protein